MMSGVDVLIAVEDPGAANFMLELPEAFEKAGASCRVAAWGHDRGFLRDRGVGFVEPAADTDPGEVLNAHSPRLLLAGTSQNLDSPVLALIDAAKDRGITVVGFVDMAADAALRFCGRSREPLRHAPDWLLAADRATERAFAELGFPGERMLMCGHPAHDRVRRKCREFRERDRSAMRRELLGGDPYPRPVWMFVAEHGNDPRLLRGPEYTLHGRGGSDRRADIVLEEILDAAAGREPRPFVVLRLHPKNTREEFARYSGEVDFVSVGGDPLDFVWASDFVLGMCSMLLMEAALAGRPTLSVVPMSEEREWSPSVEEGLTPCVGTREDLRAALDRPYIVRGGAERLDALALACDFVLGQL